MTTAQDGEARKKLEAEQTVRLPIDQLVGALNEHVSSVDLSVAFGPVLPPAICGTGVRC